MSADIINLRRIRKDKARAEKEQKATENRVLFGEAKHLKQARKAEEKRAAAQVEAGRIVPLKGE